METLKTLAALSLIGLGLLQSAAAQGFPSRPIKLVIGFPAGGPLDQHARLLTDKLTAVLGQPIIVDYKGGRRWYCGRARSDESRRRRLHDHAG